MSNFGNTQVIQEVLKCRRRRTAEMDHSQGGAPSMVPEGKAHQTEQSQVRDRTIILGMVIPRHHIHEADLNCGG